MCLHQDLEVFLCHRHWSNISLLWTEYHWNNISTVSFCLIFLSGFTSSSKADPGTFSLAGFTNTGQVCRTDILCFFHHFCLFLFSFNCAISACLIHPSLPFLSACLLFSQVPVKMYVWYVFVHRCGKNPQEAPFFSKMYEIFVVDIMSRSTK